MKRLLLIAVTALIAVTTVTSFSASGNASEMLVNPSDVVNQFIENVNDGRLAEAYLLTSQNFQAIIPRDAFISFHEMLNYKSTLSYKVGNATIRDEKEAEVAVIVVESYTEADDTVSSEAVFKLTKEGAEWRICLDWKPYYSFKVELLPPIADFNNSGVAIILKYILIYPTTEKVSGYTELRLDIKNNSSRYLEWQLPIPGTAEGYIKDPDTDRTFYPSYAYGILANRNQDFYFIPWKDNLGTMLIGPNAEVTLYIHIDEIMPDTIKEVDIFLSGLSFCDNDEICDVKIDSVPCRFEVAPTQ